MTDESFATLIRKYPNVQRKDIEEVVTMDILAAKAHRVQYSEIEFLKSKALDAMGTDKEMKFSDIESGMLRASLSDGREALKEIMEKTPVEVPSCSDGAKMKNQGRKKKHNDNSGRN
jgi:hypothetical protein